MRKRKVRSLFPIIITFGIKHAKHDDVISNKGDFTCTFLDNKYPKLISIQKNKNKKQTNQSSYFVCFSIIIFKVPQ